MTEFLKALGETPIAIILIVAGLVFLAAALFQVTVNVKPVKTGKTTIRRQVLASILGLLLIAGGIYIAGATGQLAPTPTATAQATDNPALLATVIASTERAATVSMPAELTRPAQEEPSIAISEVMAAPCVPKGWSGPSSNEYIELYNFGSERVDVGGWWIATNTGTVPQQLVSWDRRNPGAVPEQQRVLTTSTVVAPSRFAVVLAPLYQTGDAGLHEPYKFPEGTVILTVANGTYLGDDITGLQGNARPLTVILLYKGTDATIAEPISTYGTPTFHGSPASLEDDGIDLIPLTTDDCHSVSRIELAGPDAYLNWRVTKYGTPGW